MAKSITIKGLISTIISSAAEIIEETSKMPLPYIRAVSKLGDAFENEVDLMITPKEEV